jgi:Flp pilus assembly protein TadG
LRGGLRISAAAADSCNMENRPHHKLSRQRRQRGQSLLEFALALPVIALILFGLTDFGLAYFNEISITSAARAGARAAAVSGTTTQGQSAITDTTKDLVNCPVDSSNTTITSQTDSAALVEQWTVTVSCKYTPVTPLGSLLAYFGGSSGSTIEITQTAVIRAESCSPSNGQQDCTIN